MRLEQTTSTNIVAKANWVIGHSANNGRSLSWHDAPSLDSALYRRKIKIFIAIRDALKRRTHHQDRSTMQVRPYNQLSATLISFLKRVTTNIPQTHAKHNGCMVNAHFSWDAGLDFFVVSTEVT